MKIYSSVGISEFIVCLGYKSYVVKEYFANYFHHNSDLTIDIANNKVEVRRAPLEEWRVTLIDTGEKTEIGGRIKRILPLVADDPAFCLTYGDGVANVDIQACIALHRAEGRLCTVTAVQPPGRFGAIRHEGSRVTGFAEKPVGDGGWLNGGFFVVDPRVGSYIEGDATVWEREPLERLAAENQLSVYFHRGFWQPMDTLRDRRHLEALWDKGEAPWKMW
jgi:glucose-1-phosphate cytidylyltransferase